MFCMMSTIDDLRELFAKRLEEGIPIPPGEFCPQDLDRLKDDKYLLRVLEQSHHDALKASKTLWNIMKWRKMIGAGEINDSSISMDYVNQGIFFPYGRDLEGCRVMVVRCKNYVRAQIDFEELKKIMVYWLDRLEREENGQKITLFFDLDQSGLKNFDPELIRYMISLLAYYPSFLKRIAVYELPWILNAAFKLVKKLLPPEAVEIMVFVNKDNVLKEIMSPEQALTCWGGKNNYVFEFIPEKKPSNKKVTFVTERQCSRDSTKYKDDEDKRNSGDFTNFNTDDNEVIDVQPNERILFKLVDEELVGEIKVENLKGTPIAFKIRTTAPEKFWVRPTAGKIAEKKSQLILITILPGYQKTVIKERFLIMAAPIEKDADVSEVWKGVPKAEIEEHRLKCKVSEFPIPKDQNFNMDDRIFKDMDTIKADLVKLKGDIAKANGELRVLRSEVLMLKMYQYLSVFLGLITVFIGFYIYKGLSNVTTLINYNNE